MTDVIETFKGILETLDLMALDMANFTIQMAKPDIIAHSVEYERKKFADLLKVTPDGLEHTRKWLLRHLDPNTKVPKDEDYNAFIRATSKRVFINACIELLEWKEEEIFPETFMLDELRLKELSIRTYRVIIVGTALLMTVSNVDQNLQTLASFKDTLKNHICLLCASIYSDKDLPNVLPNIADQVIKDISEARKAHNMAALSEVNEKAIKQQILEIANSDQSIRQLVRKLRLLSSISY